MAELINLLEKRSDTESLQEIQFDPIPVGDDDIKSIYAENLTNQTVKIDPTVSNVSGSGNVNIESYQENIQPDETAEIKLSAEAIQMDQLSGISADVTVEAKAIVPPNQNL